MKILFVEDDQSISKIVCDGLKSKSYIVEAANDGAEGSFLARNYEYDTIILDYTLPKKDGLAICKEIRSSGRTTPIIFLSSTSDSELKVKALNEGADDYVTKPFSLAELMARIKAISRRPQNIKKDDTIKVGDVIINVDKQICERNSRKI